MTTPPNTIAICSMQRIDETIAATGATRLVSIVNPHLMPPTPQAIDPSLHLRLPISDARPPRAATHHPARPMIEQLIAFMRDWSQHAPLVIHCFSGLNRSPAAGYIALAALNPDVPETLIAYRLRAASETASPDLTMIGVADLVLGRNGHLLSAIELIGPGQPAAEGRPFMVSPSFSKNADV